MARLGPSLALAKPRITTSESVTTEVSTTSSFDPGRAVAPRANAPRHFAQSGAAPQAHDRRDDGPFDRCPGPALTMQDLQTRSHWDGSSWHDRPRIRLLREREPIAGGGVSDEGSAFGDQRLLTLGPGHPSVVPGQVSYPDRAWCDRGLYLTRRRSRLTVAGSRSAGRSRARRVWPPATARSPHARHWLSLVDFPDLWSNSSASRRHARRTTACSSHPTRRPTPQRRCERNQPSRLPGARGGR
jgi:hypothetical protein